MTILIIAPQHDIHARCVAQVISDQHNRQCVIWDSGELPTTAKSTFALGDQERLEVTAANGETFDISEFERIWWRRPSSPRIDETVTDERVRRYCSEETNRFLTGVMSSTCVEIVNDPDRESQASRKPFQLKAARQFGLRTPKTVMTNDPTVVRQFYAEHRDCIYKTFRSPSWQMVETRRLGDRELMHLETLRHSPVIIQEYIELGRDIRATVVNDEVYCASPDLCLAEAQVDWRIDFGATWRPIETPNGLAEVLVKLVRGLGLRYGCIDLREDPSGEIVFLEINPSGQFLFVEVDSGLPIVQAFARMLVGDRVTERRAA